MFEFVRNEFELGENKFERERETIIFSIRQYPFNSVVIFRKRHNILERFFFRTRKHIEVGLNLSLAAGPKRYSNVYSMFLCFFELASVFFLLARYGRKTD